MDVWTPETIKAYYYDPEIVRFEAGFGANGGVAGGPIVETGFYILQHCGRTECCRPDGPFASIEAALEWSRQNLER